MRALQAGYKCVRLSDHLLKYRVRQTGVSKIYALERFLRMKYIRNQFQHNNQLSQLTEKDWNTSTDNLTANDKKQFEARILKLTEIKKNFSNGNKIKAGFSILKLLSNNSYFRMYFFDNIRWMLVSKII